jgi:hypothetical protein
VRCSEAKVIDLEGVWAVLQTVDDLESGRSQADKEMYERVDGSGDGIGV